MEELRKRIEILQGVIDDKEQAINDIKNEMAMMMIKEQYGDCAIPNVSGLWILKLRNYDNGMVKAGLFEIDIVLEGNNVSILAEENRFQNGYPHSFKFKIDKQNDNKIIMTERSGGFSIKDYELIDCQQLGV